MVRFSFLTLLIALGLITTACEFAAVEKVCIPLSGTCQDDNERSRLMCNEHGTGWVQSDCPAGSFCSAGVCSTQGGDLIVTTTSLPDGLNYEPYSLQLEVTGGLPPYGWKLSGGELPDGLTLTADGVISGSTIEAGTWELTFMVTDSAMPPAYSTQTFDLTMDVAPMSITSDYSYEYMGQSINILGVLIPYVEYNSKLGVKGGLPPHEWNTETPPAMLTSFIPFWGLPEGLTMDEEGNITGTVNDTSTANQVQIPGSETTLTGYFLYMSVTDSSDSPTTLTGIFLIPTIPFK